VLRKAAGGKWEIMAQLKAESQNLKPRAGTCHEK